MLKNRKLIEDTLRTVDQLKITVNEDALQKLKMSLSIGPNNREANSDYCELSISSDEVDRLVEALFDAEAEYAPKGVGLGSGEDESRAREAKSIAKIINEWNIDNKR